MAPSKHTRPNGQLKLEQKVKIIALYAEDSTLNFRKFTEKVNFRLNSQVSRSKIQRIIKNKDEILSLLIHQKIFFEVFSFHIFSFPKIDFDTSDLNARNIVKFVALKANYVLIFVAGTTF